MGRICCLAVLLMACGTDPSGPNGGDDDNPGAGEPASLSGITAAHNAVRAEVGVSGMTWNTALADLATGFIADCQFEHSGSNERMDVAGFEYIGENLYASGGGGPPTGAQITDAWASEKSDYDYDTNSCNGVCGHYTQIVWRTTTKVGCALHTCPGLQFGSTVVCNYAPGGNSGGRPY